MNDICPKSSTKRHRPEERTFAFVCKACGIVLKAKDQSVERFRQKLMRGKN